MIWEQTKRKMIAGKEIPLEFETIWNAFTKKSSSNAGIHRMKLYANRLRRFCDWMKEHCPEIKRLSAVLPRHAAEWFNSVRAERCSNSTKNDHLAALKMIFSALGKDYGIIESPFSELKKLPQNQVSRETFTPEELALIGRKATGWIYSLCLTAVSTGLREGDICMLKKSSVNLNTGWISIPKTRKTGVAADIPLLPGLRKHLAEVINADPDSEFVYPELAEKYQISPTRIGPEVKAFLRQIGITGTLRKMDGYKNRLSAKDIHSFRHTFVYLASCHGIPFPIVQGIVGHTSPEMTRHYMDHAGREAKHQYLQQLPDYLTDGRTSIPGKMRSRQLDCNRALRILKWLTPENLPKNKVRLMALLRQ